MNKIGCFLSFLLIPCIALQARILTVENDMGAGQYRSLQEAHDAANNGDTLYVYPSFNTYEPITLTKRLAIYGIGFEPPDSLTPKTHIGGTMTFAPGADGSSLISFGGGFNVIINTNNIHIKRDSLCSVLINSNHYGISLTNNIIVNNFISIKDSVIVSIVNNLIINYERSEYDVTGYYSGIVFYGNYSSISVINNIIMNFNTKLHNYNCPCFAIGPVRSHNHCLIENNVIMAVHGITNLNSTLPYNICFSNPDSANNLFVNYSGGDYHLKPGSPAIGAGCDGQDIGIYGGLTPFVDGGYPRLPVITKIETSGIGTKQSGVNVHIKAKSVP
jgi:hypothetical protein